MKWNHIWAIARKDLQDATGNTSVWLPMLIVPLIFVVLLPLAVILLPGVFGASSITSDPDLQTFLDRMPSAMSQVLQGLDPLQSMIVMMLGYLFAPFFLIIPLMFSTTIAAESFAGERERKTIEALLYSPATDRELFIGKLLAGLLPAVVLAWLSFAAYTLIVNLAAMPVFGRAWFPLPTWWPLIFWVTPALAVLGVSITVLISTRVQTFMGAYQTSASTVILVLGLIIGQATGLLYLNVLTGLLIGLVVWLLDLVLLYFATRMFNRKALLAAK